MKNKKINSIIAIVVAIMFCGLLSTSTSTPDSSRGLNKEALVELRANEQNRIAGSEILFVSSGGSQKTRIVSSGEKFLSKPEKNFPLFMKTQKGWQEVVWVNKFGPNPNCPEKGPFAVAVAKQVKAVDEPEPEPEPKTTVKKKIVATEKVSDPEPEEKPEVVVAKTSTPSPSKTIIQYENSHTETVINGKSNSLVVYSSVRPMNPTVVFQEKESEVGDLSEYQLHSPSSVSRVNIKDEGE